ncbi:FHA domain-containing protein [Nostoc sp.]|uniref:FHA domain-containing protein n=1 Tax=Nostoc sp. TaxID=1180 RepID=UPI002FF8DE69
MCVFLAQLEISKGNNVIKQFPLNNDLLSIGRGLDNGLVFKEPVISRHHAQIHKGNNHYILTDLGSADGTYLNGTELSPRTPRLLENGDLIRIGCYELLFSIGVNIAQPLKKSSLIDPTIVSSTQLTTETPDQYLDLSDRQTLIIGRDPRNDTVINHPSVSGFHAQIRRKGNSFFIADLNSTNGTFLNGKQVVSEQLLKVGDTILIGANRLLFNFDETITCKNEEGSLRLDALKLNKVVGKGVNLLHNISVSIQPREFVVVAGVSGGGKSTLLNALNGFQPATSGTVLVNGIDFYKNFNAYRTQIGYVPQQDIIHKSLTVEQTLDYASQLRMPADTTVAERRNRVQEVLVDLELTDRRNERVEKLSGGQLKRVSMGVELLTKPSLFFLDEATSGLDPGTEGEIMRLLRKSADQGRTVILITHATDNVMLCDLVVFLAKDGHLAYFGPPQEALSYFSVEKFNQIYRLVEYEKSPQEWQCHYLSQEQCQQYKKYIVERQQDLPQPVSRNLRKNEIPDKQSIPRQVQNLIDTLLNRQSINGVQKQTFHPLPGGKVKRISPWQQFCILSSRNLAILLQDKVSLWLMLAIAPLLGLLDFVLWPRHLFDVEKGDAQQSLMMLFMTVIIAIMVGSLSSMREIVKEKEIYQRERMVCLQIVPYILSKLLLGVLVSLYQAAIFLLFKFLAIDIPGGLSVVISLYIILALATIGGMVMGLLVSALSPNQNVAPLLIILFIIPQITFGSGFLPTKSLGLPGQLISNVTISKWAFESIVTITGWGRDIAKDKCFSDLAAAERKNLGDFDKERRCTCLGGQLFHQCYFPGIRAKYDPAVDIKEPNKPIEPGDFPSNLSKLDAYKEKVNQYKKDVNKWQEEYSDWKQKRESAIGEVEGIIGKFYEDYGSIFNVNLVRHGGTLVVIIVLMLAVILPVQKRKDIL